MEGGSNEGGFWSLVTGSGKYIEKGKSFYRGEGKLSIEGRGHIIR